MKAILADYSRQMGKSIFVCEAGGPSTPGNPERLRRGGNVDSRRCSKLSLPESPHSPWAWKIIFDDRDAGLGAGFIFVAAGRSPDAERGEWLPFASSLMKPELP
jgi:hypothetical protein